MFVTMAYRTIVLPDILFALVRYGRRPLKFIVCRGIEAHHETSTFEVDPDRGMGMLPGDPVGPGAQPWSVRAAPFHAIPTAGERPKLEAFAQGSVPPQVTSCNREDDRS